MKRNTTGVGASQPVSRNSLEDERRIRVLVADDNEFMRHCIRLLLTREGCEVVGVANDGKELVTLAAAIPHELVVTDIHMPKMDGLKATREILHSHASTRVILLTSDDDYETARVGFEIGAMGYVVKDGMVTDLRDAIEAVLAGKVFLSGCVVRNPYVTSHVSAGERQTATVNLQLS